MAIRTDAVERSKANSGRRCDHEILWPPLDTVKWTREHIPIVFFTERQHSEQSALGLTGSYETGRIDQAEVHSSGPTPFLCGQGIPRQPAYLKVHTASFHFLGNGKIRSFGCSLLFSGVACVTHHGLQEALSGL